jgi:hypothetical protein
MEELRQCILALTICSDFYVVEQEYLVVSNLEMRNDFLAQKCNDSPLNGFSDGRIAGRGRPDPVFVAARIIVSRARDADVRALESRADPTPYSAHIRQQ